MPGLRDNEPLSLTTEIGDAVKNSTQVVVASDSLHYTFHTTKGNHHATMSSASDPKIEKAETAKDKTEDSFVSVTASAPAPAAASASASAFDSAEIEVEAKPDVSTDVPPPGTKTLLWNAMRFPWNNQVQADAINPADDATLEDVDLDSSRESNDSEPEYEFLCGSPDRAEKKKRSEKALAKQSSNDSDSEDDEWVVLKANAKPVSSESNKPETKTSVFKESELNEAQSENPPSKEHKPEKQTTKIGIASYKPAGAFWREDIVGCSSSKATPTTTGVNSYADSKVTSNPPEFDSTSSGNTAFTRPNAPKSHTQLKTGARVLKASEQADKPTVVKSHPGLAVKQFEHGESNPARSEYVPKVVFRGLEDFSKPEQRPTHKEEPKPKELPTSAFMLTKTEQNLETKAPLKTQAAQYNCFTNPYHMPHDPSVAHHSAGHSQLLSNQSKQELSFWDTLPRPHDSRRETVIANDSMKPLRFGQSAQSEKVSHAHTYQSMVERNKAHLAEVRAKTQQRYEEELAEKRAKQRMQYEEYKQRITDEAVYRSLATDPETSDEVKAHARAMMLNPAKKFKASSYKMEPQSGYGVDKGKQPEKADVSYHVPRMSTKQERTFEQSLEENLRIAALERARAENYQASVDIRARDSLIEGFRAENRARTAEVMETVDQIKAETARIRAQREKEEAEDAKKRAQREKESAEAVE
ncbi:hypothetical protein F5Y18DRAFT_110448 [Xylariaceae sp. FL1019]|nr:hypothetical protein F5Y18DRAFT_110448 [Xylariaceae sp. FL1019]